MKNSIFIFATLVLLFVACQRDEQSIRQMCEEIHAQYPSATLQDVYKTCYQDYFGAEHLVIDTASARQYLHEELVQCCETDLTGMPKREPTGFRHRFVRINLSCVLDGEMTEDQLLERFLEASGKENASKKEDWVGEWQRVERIALEVCPDWADDTLQSELLELARVGGAVRHSDSFRAVYKPHYRIVRNVK